MLECLQTSSMQNRTAALFLRLFSSVRIWRLIVHHSPPAALLPCSSYPRFPPLKPAKRLEVLWKTTAKHFKELALNESDIVISIAERRGASPTQSFTAAMHAQMTLQQVFDLLPPAPSAESMRLSGIHADCWAQRLPSVVHLYFDFTEAVRHRLRAAAAAKDVSASSGKQPTHAAGHAPAAAPAASSGSSITTASAASSPPWSSASGSITTLPKAGGGAGAGGGSAGVASKLRGAKGAGPGSLWRQKEVDRRKCERILSSDITRPIPVRLSPLENAAASVALRPRLSNHSRLSPLLRDATLSPASMIP